MKHNQTPPPNHLNFILLSVILILINLIVCLDLILGSGEPATFDGPIHITNIAQFFQALKDHDFPVVWANNLANYGSATPMVAQQLPAYLGAVLSFFIPNPLTVYKYIQVVNYLLGSIAAFYLFKRFTTIQAAFLGALLFSFSAYRIINLYIRGAGPELMAMTLIPLTLISIDRLFKQIKYSQVTLVILLSFLILTHPIIFIAAQLIIIPFIFWRWQPRTSFKFPKQLIHTYISALAICSYYLIPLIFELKYFVISRKLTQLIPNQFLNWQNYFYENWSYFGNNDIFVRANHIFFGQVETFFLLCLPLLYLTKKKDPNLKRLPLYWLLLSSLLLILLTTSLSQWLYLNIPFLDSLQFPWRLLSLLSLFPGLISAIIYDRTPRKYQFIFWILTLALVCYLRLPQVYAKNLTLFPVIHYQITQKNPYLDEMNTLWTGATDSYPPRNAQLAIISGEGQIKTADVSNSHRQYQILAQTALRLVDYTFYFPGWQVIVDGLVVPIEFQDEQYRGIITFNLPPGNHVVRVVLKPTKTRLLGNWLSILGLGLLLLHLVSAMRQKNHPTNTSTQGAYRN